MATVAKKQPSGAEKNVDPFQVTGNWVEHIEKMSDLGKGYLLVKFNTKSENTPPNRRDPRAGTDMAVAAITPQIKKFSPGQLRQLLERFSDQLAVSSVDTVNTLPSAPKTRRASNENNQFMENLRAQEVANRRRDFDDGRLLTSTALAEQLQMTTQALGKAVRSNRMFTLDGPSGRRVYPAFFADPRCNREHIERVSQALGGWPGPSKWEFFTSPRASLNGLTPIEALAQGELDQVLRAASAFTER